MAEYVGSMLLVVSILRSTILAHEIFEASVPLSVFIAAFTTGGWLFALVEVLGPISGCRRRLFCHLIHNVRKSASSYCEDVHLCYCRHTAP